MMRPSKLRAVQPPSRVALRRVRRSLGGGGKDRPYIALLILIASVVSTGPRISAQHATAFDVEDGGRLFRNNCVNCHGPDGNEVPDIDLGRGQFRTASTDADLNRIIRSGVPNTPMPPSSLSEADAARVVAYLRSLAETKRSVTAAGDAARGRSIFEGAGTCTSCHRVSGRGSRLGPDLSEIGQVRRAVELERSLLEPDAEVLPANRFYRVVSKDGVTTTGRLLNLDTFTVLLMDSKQQLRAFSKSDLREHGFVEKTPMPTFKDRLTQQQLADLVSYLVSLKARVTP